MPAYTLLSVSLCLILLCNGSQAQFMTTTSPWMSQHRFIGPRGCRFDRIEALNPSRRVRFEAGMTEYYQWDSEMVQCAGVAASRHVLEPRGLLLPHYNNAPSLMYIVQGRGFMGTIFPGCPETYQSFRQQTEVPEQYMMGSQKMLHDEHQKVHRFKQGDVIALPAGVTYWCYSDGDMPMISVQVYDASNAANQLDPTEKRFFIAGRHQNPRTMSETGQQSFGMGQPTENNIFSGFDTRLLAEALGVNQELAQRLQSQNDPRGEMVFVKQGLQMIRPFRTPEIQQQQYEEGTQSPEVQYDESVRSPEEQYDESVQGPYNVTNGLDEMFCMMKIRSNIDKPSRADYFNQRGSRIATLNSQKLPIMNIVQMSAARVVLQRNTMITPYWYMNCHSVMYVTGGQGRVQISNHQGKTVFDGLVHAGQMILIPQNYVMMKRAERETFQWVSFNTNQNSMISQVVGKSSVLKAMPLQVLMSSYRLSMEQARRLKFSRRHEMIILSPLYQMKSSQ